jgi:hypothetical protein
VPAVEIPQIQGLRRMEEIGSGALEKAIAAI